MLLFKDIHSLLLLRIANNNAIVIMLSLNMNYTLFKLCVYFGIGCYTVTRNSVNSTIVGA